MQAIAAAVKASFDAELAALKPGNVSRYAAGHNMTAQDFVTSAEVVTPLLCTPRATVGERVLTSIRASYQAVGCNTNLGMVLLFAPLITAAEAGFSGLTALQAQLQQVLRALTVADTKAAYEAIRIANPGGLGQVAADDVKDPPPAVSLLQVMAKAAARDLIARQYASNYQVIFEWGLPQFNYFINRWNSLEWATVACYMGYLSTLPDSHIERKYGRKIADKVRADAAVVAAQFNNLADPKLGLALLTDFDMMLKKAGYNPGTSADLTATVLLVYHLGLL